MTETDNGAFEVAFKRLAGALQWRGKPVEFKAMQSEYFDALRDFPIEQVVAAAEVCRDTLKRFPRLVEWRAALPAADGPTKPADARWMGYDESADYLRAGRLAYHDDPCGCAACRAAGVSDRPLRYVPDDDRAWCNLTRSMVTPGRWIHGEELRRWYAARDAFFGVRDHSPRAARLVRVVEAAFGRSREPGEEG